MYVCMSVYTWYVRVFIHVFGGSIAVLVLSGVARRVALIRSSEEAVAKRLAAAGWVWFRCQKETGRKINGLSEVKALLQLPRPCLSKEGSAN